MAIGLIRYCLPHQHKKSLYQIALATTLMLMGSLLLRQRSYNSQKVLSAWEMGLKIEFKLIRVNLAAKKLWYCKLVQDHLRSMCQALKICQPGPHQQTKVCLECYFSDNCVCLGLESLISDRFFCFGTQLLDFGQLRPFSDGCHFGHWRPFSGENVWWMTLSFHVFWRYRPF